MKICPKCENEHEKPGTFCSRTCANSRTFSEQTKQKKSAANIKYFSTIDKKEKRLRYNKISITTAKNKDIKLKTVLFDDLSQDLKREKILIEQNECCGICNCPQKWNNQPLKFQLDHVNGKRNDNTRKNLRMICPNCHTQTETYGGKNGRKIRNKQIVEIIKTGSNNHQLCKKLGINPSKHSYKRINKLRNMPL